MIYQLKSGYTIDISLSAYLSLPDSAFEDLELINSGYIESNPFFNSALENINTKDEILDFYSEIDYIDNSESLLDLAFEDKINDKDFINDDEF